MTQFVPLIAKTATQLAFSYVRELVSTGVISVRARGRDTATPLSPVGEGGCAICAVHRKIAEAAALLNGLGAAWRDEGRLPQGLGGTIPLARRLLTEADDELISIGLADANLRIQALTVQARLNDLLPLLSEEMTEADVERAAAAAQALWEECYRLARQAFAGPPETPLSSPASDPILWVFERIRSGDLEPEAALGEIRRTLERERSHAAQR